MSSVRNVRGLAVVAFLAGLASGELGRTNQKLKRAWPEIFPTRNRNAGGPQFFRWIFEHATSEQEFDEMNQLYCGVSGSVVRPYSKPDFVELQREDGSGTTCGLFYRCCWPCTCDIEKYSRVETMEFQMGNDKFSREVVTIPDPCNQQSNIPRQVNTFTCDGGRTGNAVQAPRDGRIVMAVLGDADHTCTARPMDQQLAGMCEKRNQLTACELSRRGGMGDIFAQLSCAGDKERSECQCGNNVERSERFYKRELIHTDYGMDTALVHDHTGSSPWDEERAPGILANTPRSALYAGCVLLPVAAFLATVLCRRMQPKHSSGALCATV